MSYRALTRQKRKKEVTDHGLAIMKIPHERRKDMNNTGIEIFRTGLVKKLEERLGGEYKIIPCETLKNNGIKLFGVILRKNGSKVAPTVYLEKIFSEYETDNDIEKAVDEVIRLDKEHSTNDFDTGFYEDFRRVKDRIYAKLINRETNRELLENTPHRNFLSDLAITAYADVSEICGFDASITVKSEHIGCWGITSDELLDLALQNTRMLGCSIRDITEFLKRDGGLMTKESSPDRKLYVMTNKNTYYGAITMTFEDRLKDFCEKHGSTFIIPSSIHEVILMPDTGEYSRADINKMISEVNRCELSPEEILGSHAYYYSIKGGYLGM